MRFLRAIRVRVEPEDRDRYVAAAQRFQQACRHEDSELKGFYVMESIERPGEYREFHEFANEIAAFRFDTRVREDDVIRTALDALDEIGRRESSQWQQRV